MRSIGIPSIIHAIWQKCRASLVSQWRLKVSHRFDSAASGSSASFASFARSACAEVWSASGCSVAMIAWDVDSFFDSISVDLLVKEVMYYGYHIGLLYMSLLIHLAPRVMDFGGEQFHIPIRLAVGILAGLFDSIALAQGFLHRIIARLQSSFPSVQLRSHVDDVCQLSSVGSPHALRVNIVPAAVQLVNGLRDLGLSISSKSVVVASNSSLSKSIASRVSTATGFS